MRNADIPEELLDLMEGPRPPDSFVSNGVTFAPDFVGAVDCRAAGHVHDWHYSLGGTEKDRELADYRLYRNLVHSELSHFMAGIFFRRVRLFAIDNFRYDDPPRGWAKFWLVLRCFFSRYLRFCR